MSKDHDWIPKNTPTLMPFQSSSNETVRDARIRNMAKKCAV